MWTHVLGVIVLLETGLGAGVLFGVALALIPGFATLSPAGYVRTHQLFDPYFEPTMPTLMMTSALLSIILAVAVDGAAHHALYIVTAIALLGVIIISQFAAIPLLRMVRGINPDALPADWRDPRASWRNWHRARTVLAIVALACAASALAVS